MLDATLFNASTPLASYRQSVWRVVESQEEVATLGVVDDIEEQGMLESMLDEVKPAYRAGTEGMHYLLKTAFRYPPLKWGSRFGSTLMPSYFYASEAQATALCECAYYRFLFLEDMLSPYGQSIRSEYSVFSALVASESSLDLTSMPFRSISADISRPTSYALSQSIGHWCLEREDIDLIRFASARHPGGTNVAVANPRAVRSRKPTVQERWLCLTKPNIVSFSSRASEVSFVFPYSDFCNENGTFLRVL